MLHIIRFIISTFFVVAVMAAPWAYLVYNLNLKWWGFALAVVLFPVAWTGGVITFVMAAAIQGLDSSLDMLRTANTEIWWSAFAAMPWLYLKGNLWERTKDRQFS